MYRKWICLISFVLLLVASTKVKAEVFTDDFETPYDYVAVAAEDPGRIAQETIWDDFIGWAAGETVDALNASIEPNHPGQLFIASTNGAWDPWTNLGPFLYKIVEGDFIATVKVSDFAYTPNEQGYDDAYYFNNCGLMARAFLDDAGPGEDWVSIDYFPLWGCGNHVRAADDGIRDQPCFNGKYLQPLDDPIPGIELIDPYLQLKRIGNTFHLLTSPDGITWTEMVCSPITRDDFVGLPLMVGMFQATYSENFGYAVFDDFTIEIIIVYKASSPLPADGAKNVDPDIDLIWAAGAKAELHDVYFGTDLDDVENADTSTVDIYQGRQSETTYELDTLKYGTTYYWRIDEVNDSDPNLWPGDVWSFTVMSLEASGPSPSDGTECVPIDIGRLTWTLGLFMQFQDIYFGTASPPPRVKMNHNQPYYDLSTLEYDTTYYWKVDTKKLTPPNKGNWPGQEWSFRTAPQIPVAEPGLVGWWKLDDVGCGTTVLDSSGHDHHGTLRGDPQWVPGFEGDALEFDGRGDYVELPIGSVIGSLTNSTFMIWLDSQIGGSWVRAFDFNNDLDVYMCLGPRWIVMDDMYFAISTSGATGQTLVQPTGFDIETGWQHVAVTINADNNTIILYYNGTELARNTSATLSPTDLGNTANNWLGKSHDDVNDSYYLGSMDDFRIYDHALSQVQIERAMMGDPTLAYGSHPANGATADIERATPLGWSPGSKVDSHDVYFGTDEDAVADADTSTTGIYRGRQDPNTYTPSETLEFGQTYYWRIDEYNTDATISEGRPWSFTVADYVVVDDFESYDDFDNRIYHTWLDYFSNNSGATVGHLEPTYVETTIVNEGSQAMPYRYDHDGTVNEGTDYETTGTSFYSEAERMFDPAQDWTRHGVNALTLWFRGLLPVVGSFSYNPVTGIYTMTARGADIGGTSDQFHYAFRQMSGFGSIVAKVLNVSDTDASAKAGVMIRATLDPGSANALVAVTPGDGLIFQVRTTAGGETVTTATEDAITAPHWVKLERGGGNAFAAYHSTDGSTWEPLGGPMTIGMEADVYVGLALAGNNVNTTCVAQFSDVTTTATGNWQSQDIGIASNVAEQLYVKLEDSSGNSEVVEHPDPDAVLSNTWQEWSIDLQNFAGAGVNTASIKKMYIRVGDKDDPNPGGTGMLYIDDIRLRRPRCIPSLVELAGDLSGNCVVDYLDLEMMALDWLVGDQLITTTDPGTASLVGHWKLDDGSGIAAADSSVNNNNGSLLGGPQWGAGYDGGALEFDGYKDHLELPIGSVINSLTNSTFATWANFSNAGGAWQRLFDFGIDPNVYMFLTPRMGTADAMRFAITTGGAAGESQVTAPDTLPSGWHHVAVTIDADDDTITLYLDAAVAAQNTRATLSPSDLGVTTNNWLGRSQYAVDAFYRGLIDDFRIYSRALTQAEIAHLADKTPGDGQFHIPVASPAELYEAEPEGSRAVNLMDFAVLAESWLDERLWP